MRINRGFSENLMRWHRAHGRHNLPWRKTRNPYRILVSEMMLQQTQVERVIPKYRAFLKRFPTLRKLARASTASVLRAWRGMGYNRRALYLKRCAYSIVHEHNGRVPNTYEVLRRFPGVGDYTTRAVLVFAFGKPVVLWDTNIRRIFSRMYFGVNPSAAPEEKITNIITTHPLPVTHSALYHGALMDLGTTVCKTKPLCSVCPMQKICKASPRVLARGWRALEGRIVRHPQSKFEGSNRQLRGRLINLLRTQRSVTPSAAKLLHADHVNRKRITAVLQTLLRDGLIIKKGSVFTLPR